MNEKASLKPLVLVIDDEVQIRRLLRACLESNGYRVVEASTGKEGISQLAQHPPDLVILDLGLADMEGIAVL
jgi:two-component system KDP operon response regulator KdpE